MGLFSAIADKIFHHHAATPDAAATPAATPAASTASASASPASASPDVTSQPVDVEAVLTDMASKKGGGGNYQSSIVDLLKLLDLDSSLNARKELGSELGVHVGEDGSA
ncbi:MAG: DUF3597 domain-containing protein, partial [Pseudomonadota bacterium]|nr:DUF3597 domain-containing protein [Pseudomonadota bacterium]